MKKIIGLFIIGTLLSSCGSWVRLGDMNMISTRNVDVEKHTYELIKRDVEAVAKTDGQDAMVQAIDNLCKEHQGEFVKNVKVYVRNNGKKVRVVGDVWGDHSGNVNIIHKSQFQVGDSIFFKKNGKGKPISGKIKGLSPNKVIVEDIKGKIFEVNYDDVTGIN